MNKRFTISVVVMLALSVNAQTQTVNINTPSPIPTTQPYGKVDMADLQMTSCDFEKDANAEVLFEKAAVYCGTTLSEISSDSQKRIKIFNDNGKDQANI